MKKINNIKKIATVSVGTIGLGLIIYNIKQKLEFKKNHPTKNIIKRELKELIEAECIFENILLNQDKHISLDSINENTRFKALDYAKTFYFKSNTFRTNEIKEASRMWYLNKLNTIGFFEKTSTEGRLNETFESLNDSKKELIKLIKFYKIDTQKLITEEIEVMADENTKLLELESEYQLVSFIKNIKNKR